MLPYRYVGPMIRLLDPEAAHGLTLRALRAGLVRVWSAPDEPVLATRVWGLDFANPVGLAAGFDKDAAVVGPALDLGFGFVEIGTVTPRPQAGNPKPRIFRLPEDRAVINRLGFNNEGAAAAVESLEHWREAEVPGILGVNVGKNRDSEDAARDYAAVAGALGRLADYVVINVSSPNTPGLRALQGRDALEPLVAGVREALDRALPEGPPPLLVKIAPDLAAEDLAQVAGLALDGAVDGIVATNTTVARPDGLAGQHRGEAGGLSGRPLFELSTQVLAETWRLTEGRVPLIGVGGVSGGAEAYAKIRAGASLVQLYTALVYEGPELVGRIKGELAALLRRDGFSSVADAVGADHR